LAAVDAAAALAAGSVADSVAAVVLKPAAASEGPVIGSQSQKTGTFY
jgi:hypothetical protein